jgi:hypothetical protein
MTTVDQPQTPRMTDDSERNPTEPRDRVREWYAVAVEELSARGGTFEPTGEEPGVFPGNRRIERCHLGNRLVTLDACLYSRLEILVGSEKVLVVPQPGMTAFTEDSILEKIRECIRGL